MSMLEIVNIIFVAETSAVFGLLYFLSLDEGMILHWWYKIIENKSLINDLKKFKFSEKIYEVPFINAAIWLMSNKCLKTVGGFSPVFFHYGEDNNYCHRVIYHNLKIGIVPLLKAYHFNYENQNKYYSKNNVLKFINIFKGIYSNPNNKWIINRDIIIYMFQLTYNLFRLKISVLNFFLLIKNILSLDFKKIKTCKAKSMYDNTPFIS